MFARVDRRGLADQLEAAKVAAPRSKALNEGGRRTVSDAAAVDQDRFLAVIVAPAVDERAGFDAGGGSDEVREPLLSVREGVRPEALDKDAGLPDDAERNPEPSPRDRGRFDGRRAPRRAAVDERDVKAIRVPLPVRGPGFAAGVRDRRLVVNVDLAPSILKATGATAERELDGRSLRAGAALHRHPRDAVLLEVFERKQAFTGFSRERPTAA